VAKKGLKRSTTKKTSTKAGETARRPPSKAATTARGAVPARPAPAAHGPALVERAERLRDEILRSKLTHPNPWTYAAKARGWGERAQVLVELIVVQGPSPTTLRTLEGLHAEVERDRDFQEARRLF
jgi:hypothetical protein